MNWNADSLASLPPEERQRFLASLSEAELEAIKYDWRFWARPDQVAPQGDWYTWLIQAGRGWGKTRAEVEAAIEWAMRGGTIIHIIARTAADYRDVLVTGPAGFLACSPPWFMPVWEPSKRLLTWPNGSKALCFSSEKPNQLRGPQCHKVLGDEVAAWRYPETLENALLGCRLGDDPQIVLGSTPKPTKTFKEVLKLPDLVITRGSTMDNRANLAKRFIDNLLFRYDGTRLGQQELYGELLDDNPRALWQRRWLDRDRVKKVPRDDELDRIVIAIDPASAEDKERDEVDFEDLAEHGMVVCGRGSRSRHGYVLEDASFYGTPREWAERAVYLFHKYKANKIVAESNNGGEMVRHTIHTVDRNVPVELVWASRGKETRAEPVSALYEQCRVHHVGLFADLESQMCEWVPGAKNMKSPDRMDALVWALTDLLVEPLPEIMGFNY
jgi:phage terminase large subunit-like protein